MTYQGYTGVLEVDEDTGRLFGRVADLRDVITFEGTTLAEARRDFEAAVDFYLGWCAERGKEPERPAAQAISIRIDPDLHRRLATLARARSTSLDVVVAEALAAAVATSAD
jgi:predicted HicB family RNase H-like nuclease